MRNPRLNIVGSTEILFKSAEICAFRGNFLVSLIGITRLTLANRQLLSVSSDLKPFFPKVVNAFCGLFHHLNTPFLVLFLGDF